jgi:hypothetical protein
MSLVIAAVLFVGGLAALFCHLDAKATRRMIAEFEAAFPDRCVICSYNRFGRTHFGEQNDPPPHDCKEKGSPL